MMLIEVMHDVVLIYVELIMLMMMTMMMLTVELVLSPVV